jgi:hypothetical protein
LSAAAVPLVLVGVAVHGWAMYDKRRLERGVVERHWWIEALYWLCWVLLAAVVVSMLVAF